MSKLTLTADMPVLENYEWKREVARNPRLVSVKRVPLSMFGEECERQAERNHYQTLARLRERGGLSPTEMIAVLTCCDWEAVGKLSRETAHRVLYSMIALHNRGMRVAERAALNAPETSHTAPVADAQAKEGE